MAFAGKIRAKHGNSLVEFDDTTNQMIEDLLNTAAPGALRRLERATDEIVKSAKEAAPVRTGQYKETIRSVLTISRDTLEAAVVADPKKQGKAYAWAIKQPWPNNHRRVVNEDIFKPGKKLVDQLVIDLADELVALAGGRK